MTSFYGVTMMSNKTSIVVRWRQTVRAGVPSPLGATGLHHRCVSCHDQDGCRGAAGTVGVVDDPWRESFDAVLRAGLGTPKEQVLPNNLSGHRTAGDRQTRE